MSSRQQRRQAFATALRDAMNAAGISGPAGVAKLMTDATGGVHQYDRQLPDAWLGGRSAPDVDDAHLLEEVLDCWGKLTSPLGYMPAGVELPDDRPVGPTGGQLERLAKMVDQLGEPEPTGSHSPPSSKGSDATSTPAPGPAGFLRRSVDEPGRVMAERADRRPRD